MPHMHWLGKDFTFTAVLPDGETPFVQERAAHGVCLLRGGSGHKDVPALGTFDLFADNIGRYAQSLFATHTSDHGRLAGSEF
jgi:hypothetical protein